MKAARMAGLLADAHMRVHGVTKGAGSRDVLVAEYLPSAVVAAEAVTVLEKQVRRLSRRTEKAGRRLTAAGVRLAAVASGLTAPAPAVPADADAATVAAGIVKRHMFVPFEPARVNGFDKHLPETDGRPDVPRNHPEWS